MLCKLESCANGCFAAHEYPRRFQRGIAAGVPRLVIGVRSGTLDPLPRLVPELGNALKLLYVLHTSRIERAHLGRYESPWLKLVQVGEFLARFKAFLAQDGRHDLWIADPESGARIVLDRHHVLYAYGPLDEFVRELSAAGFERGEIAIPSPHAHHYHAEFDADERAIVDHFAWRKTDLRRSDVQWEEPPSNTEGGG